MSIEEQQEMEIGAEQHQTDLETIKAWIREGRIKTTDRARKRGHAWTRISLGPQPRGVTPGECLIAAQATQRMREEIPKEPTGAAHSKGSGAGSGPGYLSAP